ncbi:branched-chain amino acid aminotransferase [Candidatus Methanoplasma termitum]|uniref:Branched-chain-amino-acid aminotransferase n=1 Tax=Candidatus Methanoplasma termitum TaxID=1577791 RepID=A0A0A7LD66_9ARCH|nr:branched-chain amino acid transaminase [Candidatus Methanoplasma termitum]AIZ57014.1 branched-chain amino acid aminotransferase [Candidatus Methanoplasma termitum]
MEKGEKIWIDGKLINWADAKVHIMTHALNYGTGVFEGIRVYQTPKGPAVFRLKEHTKRLFDGCKTMGIDPVFGGKRYTVEEVMDVIKETIKANKKVDYVKPCVFLSGEAVGLNPVGLPASLSITCIYMGSYLGEDSKSGAKLITSSWHRPDNLCGPAGAKVNGTYVTSCLAKQEAVRQGANEAVMLNSIGHVAECTGENIFIYRNGKIFTPLTSECILEGITRDSVIQVARDLGYEVIETEITRMQLVTADEVWMTGTAAEVAPVTMIDGRVIGDGKVGKVAAKIQHKFHDIAEGKDQKYDGWLYYVK